MTEKIRLPQGFKCAGIACGIKNDPHKLDLAVFASDEPCAAAGVFTQNLVNGAPVKVSRERVPSEHAQAVVINSGNANACTGEQGLADARQMTELVASQLGCPADGVLVCSTGVIGHFLPMEKLEAGIPTVVRELQESPAALENAARAMMTTDTFPKLATRQFSVNDQTITVTGVAKGAAMIGPNMATMLAVIMTDGPLTSAETDTMLRHAVDRSFNCISVEGHTSTSDTVILLANGKADCGPLNDSARSQFQQALDDVAAELAQAIIRDAEGADHIITIDVSGLARREDAFQIAKTVADSVLVKTAITGADPNWGRIVSAVGYAGVQLREEDITLRLNQTLLYEQGSPRPYDETVVSQSLRDLVGRSHAVLGDGRRIGQGPDVPLRRRPADAPRSRGDHAASAGILRGSPRASAVGRADRAGRLAAELDPRPGARRQRPHQRPPHGPAVHRRQQRRRGAAVGRPDPQAGLRLYAGSAGRSDHQRTGGGPVSAGVSGTDRRTRPQRQRVAGEPQIDRDHLGMDPAGQRLAETVGALQPVQPDRSRWHGRRGEGPAAAPAPGGSRTGRLRARRHGAVCLQGSHAGDFQGDAARRRVPRLPGLRHRDSGLSARRRGDLHDLLEWAKNRGTPVTVRLVKGAYWDYETVTSAASGWPVPVYRQKWQSDDNFERQTRFLMENHEWLRPGARQPQSPQPRPRRRLGQPARRPHRRVGNPDALRHGGRTGSVVLRAGTSPPHLHAVRRADSRHGVSRAATAGKHVERFVPATRLRRKRLRGDPADETRDDRRCEDSPSGRRAATRVRQRTAFRFQPPPKIATPCRRRLDDVAAQFGRDYPLVIGGRTIETRGSIVSRSPSHKSQTVGRVASASPDDASDAIDAARRAFRDWSRLDAAHRCEYLELVAAEMRIRRFEMAAWQVYECGKPWAEADADVAEAIDFCMYYAHEMRRLAVPRQCDVPGEENSYFYRPRGVAVVIAPWNFPLAILTGMTAAALVTGNTVIMKPAEQSSVVAAKFMELLRTAGLPDGVVNFLPGVGEEVGPELVGSPDVDLIAFTGSRTVGLAINARAAETDPRQSMVKHVIAEMGGKNAIIVDADADLDEAVVGVMHSAFGYAGQKCSACSRAGSAESQ